MVIYFIMSLEKIERLNGTAAVSDKYSDEPLGLNSDGSPAAGAYSFLA